MDQDLADLKFSIDTKDTAEGLSFLDQVFRKSQTAQKELNKLQFSLSGIGSTRSNAARTTGGGGLLQDLLGTSRTVSGEISRLLGKSFDRFLFQGKSARGLISGMEKDLLRTGNQVFTGQSSSNFGSGLMRLAGNALSSFFPGYATGGSFTVGGAAGKDRNLVGLRLSRGEQVSVRTPSQQRQNTSNAMVQSPVINLNYNIATPNVESFQRSQSQIQVESLRAAQRILKRNG
jgi:hypothetical protein